MLNKPLTEDDVKYIQLLGENDEVFFNQDVSKYICDLADRFIFESKNETLNLPVLSPLLESLLYYKSFDIDGDYSYIRIPSFNEKVVVISQLENICDIIIHIFNSKSKKEIRNHFVSFLGLLPLEKRISLLKHFYFSNFDFFIKNYQYLLLCEEDTEFFFESIEDLSYFNTKFNQFLFDSFEKDIFLSEIGFDSQVVFVNLLNKIEPNSFKFSINTFSNFLRDSIYYHNSDTFRAIFRIVDKEHLKQVLIDNNKTLNFKEYYLSKQNKFNKIVFELTELEGFQFQNKVNKLSLFDFNLSDQLFISKINNFNKEQIGIIISFLEENQFLYIGKDKYSLSDESYEVLELNFSY